MMLYYTSYICLTGYENFVGIIVFYKLKISKNKGELSERQHFQSVCITIGGSPRQGGKVFVTVSFMI